MSLCQVVFPGRETLRGSHVILCAFLQFAKAVPCWEPLGGAFPREERLYAFPRAVAGMQLNRCSSAKVTLCLEAVATTTSDAGDRIELGSVSGSGAACGNADDAQHSAAFLEPGPQVGFDTPHRVTGLLLGDAGGVPTRLGVAACAG
jgi:hypothetical protein